MRRIFKHWTGLVCLYVLTTTLFLWRGKIVGFNQSFSKVGWRLFMSMSNSDSKNELPIQLPLIYLITPTVYRSEQVADLTRMSNTLRLVPRIHWIVIEDKKTRSENIGKLLNNTGVNFTHLAIKQSKPEGQKLGPHKGDPQRNLGLDWITNHGELPSVFYLADDDNSYDLRLFEEIRSTKRVSVWPVALAGNVKYETPILKNGKVVDFASGWYHGRKFPLDMAGFAVNSKLLKRQNSPRISYNIIYGFSETSLLENLNVTFHDLEPKADNCSKILVWHTRTEVSPLHETRNLEEKLARYNITPLQV